MNKPNEHHGEGDRGRDQFRVTIDDRTITLHEPRWTGRQLLEHADRRPPEDYLLYQLGAHNLLEDIGLDETVDLRTPGIERFITFRSDRSFRFMLNGQRQDWGAPKISEANLRKLADVGPDYSVWFEQPGAEPRELHPGEMVDLTGEGAEHFHTERRLVITVHNEDNGESIELTATRRRRIKSLIAQVYDRFHVQQQPNDRLRCEQGGEDVLQFAALTLGEYLDAGHCACLVWLFVSATGGATWQQRL